MRIITIITIITIVDLFSTNSFFNNYVGFKIHKSPKKLKNKYSANLSYKNFTKNFKIFSRCGYPALQRFDVLVNCYENCGGIAQK